MTPRDLSDIRAVRDHLGLTTGGLAVLVGVTKRTAARWIDGTRTPPEPVLRLLWCVLAIEGTRAELLYQFCGEWRPASVDADSDA